MIDGPDAGLSLDRIDEWERGFAERAAQAKALAERTAQLSATARGGDELIEVTVGPNGQITDLRLDEEIRRQAAATTARQILSTVRAAQRALLQQVEGVAAETVGADSTTGKAVLSSLSARLSVDDEEPMP
ncbi:YbaB/EbfC family nucleoid-associated protein [Actinoplanes sp. NPDC051411]|uniref:YbaB/EbfC family nucleoid-associated protein n=1 Tax=Actinoplanes sp. NPDC051411 TaxID=3155522 RepID=UPI00342CCE45